MRLVFLGAPGSGKGTQAAQIVARLNIAHLSTGDMLRAAAASGSATGQALHDTMKRGQLVSDDTVVAIVAERLGQDGIGNGYILDGFPRTLAQAVALDKVLAERGEKLDAVVELQVVASDLVDRIVARAAQTKARGESVCADDNPETFKLRLQAYEAQTAPLVDYYGSKGVLKSVNGMKPMDQVTADIEKILGT